MISQLAEIFYSFVYAHRFNGVVRLPPAVQEPMADDLIEMLSQANSSRERWDANWQVSQVLPSGQVLATRMTPCASCGQGNSSPMMGRESRRESGA